MTRIIKDPNHRNITGGRSFAASLERTRAIMRELSDRLKVQMLYEKKYTKMQMMALMGMAHHGELRLKDISTQLGVSAPNLCTMFAPMERDGLVTRRIDENDRRNTFYSLSANGKKLTQSVHTQIHAQMNKLTENLTNSQIENLISAIEIVNEILGGQLKLSEKNTIL